jgi:hypothetical protein
MSSLVCSTFIYQLNFSAFFYELKQSLRNLIKKITHTSLKEKNVDVHLELARHLASLILFFLP